MRPLKGFYLITLCLSFYHASLTAITIGTLAYNPPFEVVTTVNNVEQFFGFEGFNFHGYFPANASITALRSASMPSLSWALVVTMLG